MKLYVYPYHPYMYVLRYIYDEINAINKNKILIIRYLYSNTSTLIHYLFNHTCVKGSPLLRVTRIGTAYNLIFNGP